MLIIREAKASEKEDLKVSIRNSFVDASITDFGHDNVLPPGVRDGSQIDKAFENQTIFSITYDDQVIGGIIVDEKAENDYYLQTLWIITEYQDKKIGHRAMQFLDETYPDATSWILETPKQALRNRYFYEKHGFVKIDEKEFEGSDVILCFYRRTISEK